MPNNQHGFARKEMNRCGWSEGKGLGKAETGMKDAIKVKLKNNTGGLGHNQGTEFTFHWWDHIFNKAANSFKVSEGEGGVQIEKCEGKKITPVLISNKKPLSSKYANASLMYGTFVKAGTYHSDNKELSDNLTDNDSSDDSSDDENLSLNDTLEKTFKKTGLTGHKAARHGFKLSGKLQRLENQEQQTSVNSAVLSLSNDKDTTKEISENKNYERIQANNVTCVKIDDDHSKSNIEIPNENMKKRKKKKKKASEQECLPLDEKSVCESTEKNTETNSVEQLPELNEKHSCDTGIEKSKKTKRKKKYADEENLFVIEKSAETSMSEVKKVKDKLKDVDVLEDQQPKKKKKKKKCKSNVDVEES